MANQVVFKVCIECNKKLYIDNFALIQGKKAQRKNVCKKCTIILKSPFTCELPPNTKQCSKCEQITPLEDFRLNKNVCGKCRLSPNESERRELFEQGKKRCVKCGEIKNLDMFRKKHTINKDKTEISFCKPCENKKRDINRRKKGRCVSEEAKSYHKLKLQAKKEELLANPEEHRRKKDLQRCKKFNLDLEDYYKMKEIQNNKCYICGIDESENNNGILVIDHCHTTNKVRKLLCNPCNTLLGATKEDMKYIQKLIDYIKEHQEE